MSEIIVTYTSNKKRSILSLLLTFLLTVIVIAFFYTMLLVPMQLYLERWLGESVISFLGSQVFIAISGVLYGFVFISFQSATFLEFKKGTKEHIKPLALTALLATFLIVLGYLFFFIPGFVLTILFLFYPFVVIKEKKMNKQALNRSFQLAKLVWLKLCFYVVLFYLLFLLLASSLLYFSLAEGISAEIIAGAIIVPLETLLFYRLYLKAIERSK